MLASSNKSDKVREDGLEGNSFLQGDVEYRGEFSGTEVFDNESCSDSLMEFSNSINGIPQQLDFGQLSKKLSNTTDYCGLVKVSKGEHNKRALMMANKHINHLKKTLHTHDKLLSKTHKKSSATCQFIFPILKSKLTFKSLMTQILSLRRGCIKWSHVWSPSKWKKAVSRPNLHQWKSHSHFSNCKILLHKLI